MKKKNRIIIGIILLLITILSIVDLWYIDRTINFIPYYLFGFAVYFLQFLLLLLAYKYFFPNKKLFIKKFQLFLLAVFTLGLGILLSYFSSHNLKTDGLIVIENWGPLYNDIFHDFYGNVNSFFFYNTPNHLNVGGGMIGYLLLALFNSAFKNDLGSLIIAISLMAISVIIFILPFIVRYIKKQKVIKANKEKIKEIPEEEVNMLEAKPQEFEKNNTKPSFIKEPKKKDRIMDRSKEVIKTASYLPPESLNADKDKEAPVFVNESSSLMNNSNGLKKAVFTFDDEKKSNQIVDDRKEEPSVLVAPKPAHFEFENEIDTEVNQINNDFGNDSNEIIEQPFNDAPSFNEEVPYIEPTFNQDNVDIPQNTIEESQPVIEAVSPLKVEEPHVIEQPKRKERINYIPPTTDLLNPIPMDEGDDENINQAERWKAILDNTFIDFEIGASVVSYVIGPTVTCFYISMGPGVSTTKIAARVVDINRELGGVNGRFEHFVAGTTYSGYEIPNVRKKIVSFKECYESLPSIEEKPMSVIFGKSISGQLITYSYEKFPHLLVAGATGSGKSVFVKALITTLVMRNSPDDLKLILVDPKKVEFATFRKLPHLLTPVIEDPSQAIVCLGKISDETERRYSLMSQEECVKIEEYNVIMKEKGLEPLPNILVVIDEFADISGKDKGIGEKVGTLAAKSRAAGIYLLIAMQRPSTDVISGTIRNNLPTRICFHVSQNSDSMTVFGCGGGEQLLGNGDGLFQYPNNQGLTRFQSVFIDQDEANRATRDIKARYPENYDPNYLDLTDHSKDVYAPIPKMDRNAMMENEDALYETVKETAMSMEFFSQQKVVTNFGVGFSKAGRIMHRLVEDGIIAVNSIPGRGNKVLIHNSSYVGNQGYVNSSEVTSFDTNFSKGKTYEENSNNEIGEDDE